MRNLDHRLHPHALMRFGTLFGLGMIAAGALWMHIVQRDSLAAWFPAEGWLGDLLIGAGVGLAAVIGVIVLLERLSAFQAIEQILFNTLDMPALRPSHALIFGLIAGIPEEILFRGALQPTLGIFFTALIFGALHSITPVYFVYACGAGLLLGGLEAWRGGLWAPIAAHTIIDVLMFLVLIARWRRWSVVQVGEGT
jgi:hypothetical protein